MRVYKLSTNLTDEENRNLVLNLSDEETKTLSTLDMSVSVDLLDEDNRLTTVMVSNLISLEKIKSFLNNHLVKFEVEDITEVFSNEENEDKLKEILENLTQDDILKTFGVEI
jgi:hypothetical protein